MKKDLKENQFRSKNRVAKRVFWGLFFIVGAVGILATQMGILSLGGISLLSVILLVFLAAILIKSLLSLFWPGVFFTLAGVGIIFAEQLGIENLVPWSILGAALLLSIGFSIIFRKKGRNCIEINHWGGQREIDRENFEQVVNSADGSEVRVEVSFGSMIKYINSNDLKKADLNCSFGALKVYFDNVKLNEKGVAEINLNLSFGAIELYLPKDWTVVSQVNTSFAGLEEKNPQIKKSDEKKQVILTGETSFSGVEIVYV